MTFSLRLPRRPLASLALFASLLSGAHAAPVAPPPELENKAFIVMDFDSGRILAESNADVPLPPASLTKMMTSFIVEQALKSGRLKPTDMVQVSEYAWCRGTSSESCMYLPLNGTASVLDMLRGIIVQSGNDASKAVAEHLAGNEPAFAALMNNEAQRIGMKNTHFMNATGRPTPRTKLRPATSPSWRAPSSTTAPSTTASTPRKSSLTTASSKAIATPCSTPTPPLMA